MEKGNEIRASFNENNAWELVHRPSADTVGKNRRVFKNKYNNNSEVGYMARLVAKGFTQINGNSANITNDRIKCISFINK